MILIKAVAGSHLFGTNTETSDKDYKGVFLPTAEEILLGEYPRAKSSSTGGAHSKNDKDDIDIELYSLKKFLKMCQNGDTAALELLFTPDDMILEKSVIWETIIENREKLLCSKVVSMIGYARNQAAKYGLKGTRMGTLKKVLEVLDNPIYKGNLSLATLQRDWSRLQNLLKDTQHVNFIELATTKNMEAHMEPAIEVCGKKFHWTCKIEHVYDILTKFYDSYGNRAKLAEKNQGVDWKAVSHAQRVCFQGIELLSTGNITLPLPEAQRVYLTDIKQGKLDYGIVSIGLESSLDILELMSKHSGLQNKIEQCVVDKILLDIHGGIVLRYLLEEQHKYINRE